MSIKNQSISSFFNLILCVYFYTCVCVYKFNMYGLCKHTYLTSKYNFLGTRTLVELRTQRTYHKKTNL